MANRKPDYLVKFPFTGKPVVEGQPQRGNGDGRGQGEDQTTWHKLGAAWTNDKGSINVVLDVGVAITFQPGAKLVLMPPPQEGEGGE